MPRAANPQNHVHQSRQRRYRAGLAAARTPEASAVDVAVAGAVAAYAAAVRTHRAGDETTPTQVIGGILAAAVKLLVVAGYDEARALHVAKLRLTRGWDAKEMEALVDRAGLSGGPVPITPTKRHVLAARAAGKAAMEAVS